MVLLLEMEFPEAFKDYENAFSTFTGAVAMIGRTGVGVVRLGCHSHVFKK